MLFKDDTSQKEGLELGGRRTLGIEGSTELRLRIHQHLLELLNLSLLERASRDTLRQEIRGVVSQLVAQEKRLLTSFQIDQLIEDVLDELLGLGPIEPLVKN